MHSRITRRNVFKLGLAGSSAFAASTVMGAVSQPTQATPALGVTVDQVQAALPELEAVALSFLDLAQACQLDKDYLTLIQPLFAAMDQSPYATAVDYSKPPVDIYPALSLQAYVGTYHNDFLGEIQIALQAEKLVLIQGAQAEVFPMQHDNRDIFLCQPTGENAYGLSAITFTQAAAGKMSNVTIDNLNIHDQGNFQRV